MALHLSQLTWWLQIAPRCPDRSADCWHDSSLYSRLVRSRNPLLTASLHAVISEESACKTSFLIFLFWSTYIKKDREAVKREESCYIFYSCQVEKQRLPLATWILSGTVLVIKCEPWYLAWFVIKCLLKNFLFWIQVLTNLLLLCFLLWSNSELACFVLCNVWFWF